MTMVSEWSFPTRVRFGVGSLAELGEHARALGAGAGALLVTDAGVVAAGWAAQAEASLTAAGVEAHRFDAISTNPLESEVLSATDAFKQSGAKVIVALGGGAAIDVAKLVRVAASHPLPLSLYDDAQGGSAKITEPLPPMIAVPTTAGTGSEVGRSAVFTLQATNAKTVVFAPNLIPSLALLDPALLVSLPASSTAATGMDALTHCVEAYCAQGDHPMADAIALEGIRFVRRSLVRTLEAPDDLDARADMLKASMMGAVAFQKGLGACHSMAHPLSSEHGLHHGFANALCLPAVLDFNRSAIPDRIAHIAKLLGARGDDTETLAFECSGAVRSLRERAGIVGGLSDAGIGEDDLPALAKLAMADPCHPLNPRACTADDFVALFRASL